jgi:hypothetical protein
MRNQKLQLKASMMGFTKKFAPRLLRLTFLRFTFLRFTFYVLLFAFLSRPALAQYTAEFLRIPVGARAQAMGGAYVALANDASAPHWNPAGLANREARWQIGASFVQMFNNLAQHQFLGVSYEFSPNTVAGLSWVHLGIGDIPRYASLQGTRFDRILNPALRSDGKPKGFFADSEDAVFVTFSHALDLRLLFGGGLTPAAIPARLAFGLNMKLIHQRLDIYRGIGQGLDAGVIFEILGIGDEKTIRRRIAVGMNVSDLASSAMSWNTPTALREGLPVRLALGVAYQEWLPWVLGRLTLSAARQTDRQDVLALGGEYEIRNVVFLRGGLVGEEWSAGAGVKINLIQFDYAFVSHDLGNSHRLSGSVGF